MTAQLISVPDEFDAGLSGQIVGLADGVGVRTLINGSEDIAGVYRLTITATNSHDYAFTVNGIPIEYTADGSAAVAEIQAGLIAALQAIPAANALVLIEAYSTTGLTITERYPANGAVTIAEADSSLTLATITAHSQEQPITPGRAIIAGATADVGEHPSGSAGTFVGVAVHNQVPAFDETVAAADSDSGQVPGGLPFPVLHRGVILVEVESTVAITDTPSYRHAANGALDRLGIFLTGTDSGNATALSGARYLDAGDAGDLVRLAINLA